MGVSYYNCTICQTIVDDYRRGMYHYEFRELKGTFGENLIVCSDCREEIEPLVEKDFDKLLFFILSDKHYFTLKSLKKEYLINPSTITIIEFEEDDSYKQYVENGPFNKDGKKFQDFESAVKYANEVFDDGDRYYLITKEFIEYFNQILKERRDTLNEDIMKIENISNTVFIAKQISNFFIFYLLFNYLSIISIYF